MISKLYMSAVKSAIKEKDATRIGIILQLARKFRKEPVMLKGGKKYRLVTVDPSSVDADHLPEYLKKRVTTLHK